MLRRFNQSERSRFVSVQICITVPRGHLLELVGGFVGNKMYTVGDSYDPIRRNVRE